MADQSLDLFLDWTRQLAPGESNVVGEVPFWGDSPRPYDSMRIGDYYVPGLVRISGKGYEQKLDRKSIPGHKGEKLTQLGRGVAEIDIDIAIWTAQHLEDLEDIIRLVCQESHLVQTQAASDGSAVVQGQRFQFKGLEQQAKYVKKLGPPPLDVFHPLLELYGVKKLTFIKMSIPEDKDGDGVYHLKLTAIQYVPGSDKVLTAVKTQDFSVSSLATDGTALQNQLADTAKKNAAPSKTETGP